MIYAIKPWSINQFEEYRPDICKFVKENLIFSTEVDFSEIFQICTHYSAKTTRPITLKFLSQLMANLLHCWLKN